MRIPVLQALLSTYAIALAMIGVKLKRATIWVLFAVTSSFCVAVIVNFLSPVYGVSESGVSPYKVLVTAGFAYAFLIFPLAIIVEAIRLRDKAVIYLAAFSSTMPVIFVILFSTFGM